MPYVSHARETRSPPPEAPKSKKALKRAAAHAAKVLKSATRQQKSEDESSTPLDKIVVLLESGSEPPVVAEFAALPVESSGVTAIAAQAEPMHLAPITTSIPNGNHARSSIGQSISPSPTATHPNFHPTLPNALPYPSSPGFGPRKRKASQDLKTNPLSKESKVEFVPGQENGTVEVQLVAVANVGSDHEPARKKAAIVTRTIWTFIMIGGFLRT